MFICLSLLLLLSFIVATSYFLFQRYFLISVPVVSDVIGIARGVDEQEVADLLNQSKEEILRLNTSPNQFKEAQRARGRILFEQLRGMTFNALVILFWAGRERQKLQRPGMPKDDTKTQTITDIADAGPSVRLVVLVALSRLGWWITLDAIGIKPLRNFAKLQSFAGVDGLAEYRRLVNAAASLSSSYGGDAAMRLLARLRGRRLDA